MRRFGQIEIITAVIMIVTSLAVPAGAAITWSGDVDPPDPSTWDSSTHGCIGNTGNGTMDITDGSDVIDYYGYIGYESGSTGAVTVDGAGSTWTNSRSIFVGRDGDGMLDITNGGAVSSYYGHIGYLSGSTGEVTVDGSGSTWTDTESLYVGFVGNGTLNITGGGTVGSDLGTIGYGLGSTGTVTVDGADSTWTNSDDLYVGESGNGTLNITGGGTVSNNNWGIIGWNPGSTGAVSVDGLSSTWNSREVHVGVYGNGTMDITNGGTVIAQLSTLGYVSGSTGTATIDGAGSTWTNRYGLYVGYEGNGTLNVTGGGVVNSGEVNSYYEFVIAQTSNSTSEVTIDGAGSTWTNSSDLIIGAYGNGTLNIINGGLVSISETLTIDYNGGDDSFINMDTGGMLALFGDGGDSLVDFMGLIEGTGTIRYWDSSIADWADITGATYGIDYTLEYLTEGDLAGYTMLTVSEPVKSFNVDIKPGACPNPVNVKSKGVLPVAILGTEEFDVSTIDPASVFLNGVPAIRSSFEDVGGPIGDPNGCECTTGSADGFDDLTLKFETEDIVESLGQVNTDDILTLSLTGVLNDGTGIEGGDCVVIVGRHKPINKADINEDGLVNTVDIGIVAENWLKSSIVE